MVPSNELQHVATMADHPQSSGTVQRIHRQLKAAIAARGGAAAWANHLPWVLLGMLASPPEETGLL